jgi:hypothetical protein
MVACSAASLGLESTCSAALGKLASIVGGYAEKNDGFDHRKSNFGPFYPEKPISTQELNALIERIRHLGVANVKLKPNSVAQPSTSRSLTRAEGLELLWEHIEFE